MPGEGRASEVGGADWSRMSSSQGLPATASHWKRQGCSLSIFRRTHSCHPGIPDARTQPFKRINISLRRGIWLWRPRETAASSLSSSVFVS